MRVARNDERVLADGRRDLSRIGGEPVVALGGGDEHRHPVGERSSGPERVEGVRGRRQRDDRIRVQFVAERE